MEEKMTEIQTDQDNQEVKNTDNQQDNQTTDNANENNVHLNIGVAPVIALVSWGKALFWLALAITCFVITDTGSDLVGALLIVWSVYTIVHLDRCIKRNRIEYDGQKIIQTIGRMSDIETDVYDIKDVDQVSIYQGKIGGFFGYCDVLIMTKNNITIMTHVAEKVANNFKEVMEQKIAK